MYVTLRIFWVLAIGLLAQSVAVLFVTYNFLRFLRQSRARTLSNFTPQVALIIPFKGLEPELEANIASFLNQDYPHYQVIFVVASVDDPAYAVLRRCLEAASKNMVRDEVEAGGPGATSLHSAILKQTQPGCVQASLVVAGHSDLSGGKIHNLLAGLKTVEAGAEILAFTDSDVRPKPDWLRCLVSPLQDPTVTVSSGAGWDLPGAGFWSQVRTVWDAMFIMPLGDHKHNHAWGASMAMRTVDFKRLEIAERHWEKAVSSDDTVTQAVQKADGWIRFEPRCVVASRGEVKFGEFLRWSNRQTIKLRIHWSVVWWEGAITYAYSCGTALMGLIMLALPGISAGQRLLMAGALLAVVLLVMAKGLIHQTIAKELFPEEAATLNRYGSCYWRLSLLVPWVVLLNYLLSSLTRRLEFRGTWYELRNINQIRVVRREK
jgi:cellulose synthase/poly-beta-1,6-N-acetylglucosamine synthase-like glycosyltransferase